MPDTPSRGLPVIQALSFSALDGNSRSLHIINAETCPIVLAKIELGQIAVKMPGIDVLINAD